MQRGSPPGEGGHAYETIPMEPGEEGTWMATVSKDLMGKFYTFNVKVNDKWMGDTPGINAKAVGVNGKRAAIINLKSTDPQGWETDQRPPLKSPADAIIYEMHHRDFSVDSTSGIQHKGKFLALTEHGTMNSAKLLTGIDHLIELGVTQSAFSSFVIPRRPPRQARAADGALFSFLNFCNLQ